MKNRRLKQLLLSFFGFSLALAPLQLTSLQANESNGLDEIEKVLERKRTINELNETKTTETNSIGFHEINNVESASSLPEKVNLRAFDKNKDGILENYVSSIKNQYPWGTCWTFGTLAAIEATLAYQYDAPVTLENEIDLSERHLAYFTFTPVEMDNEDYQGGEGAHFFDEDDPNKEMYAGWPGFATALFSSGIGPVLESDVPYRGKEGVISDAHYHIVKDGKVYDKNGNLIEDEKPEPSWYSPYDDWSVDPEYRYLSCFTLQESSILPQLVYQQKDESGKTTFKTDEKALETMKEELAGGKALSLCFRADMAMPGDGLDKAKYLHTGNWAHYTYDGSVFNHLIAVVGYDDNYAKENFLPGHQPPKDGAFICKNSWGEKNADFPNHRDWGVDGSGYFYLSYYDTSITGIESFYFDYNEEKEEKEAIIGQYDYMPSNQTPDLSASTPVVMANAFTAPDDMSVKTLSTQTASANTTVTYDLYRLNKDYKNPMDGDLISSKTAFYPYAGFHRADLERACIFAKGDPLSVVITTKRADGNYEINCDQFDSKLGKEMANLLETDKADIYWMNSVVNPGESFAGAINSDGAWSWKDWGSYTIERSEQSLQSLQQTGLLEAIEKQDKQAAQNALKAQIDPFALYSYDNFPIKYYADFAKNDLPFTDLGFESGNLHWALLSGDIPEVISKGLMKGKSESIFAPDDVLKRAETVMTLYRLAKEVYPETFSFVIEDSGFHDINPAAWYAEAINWARENEILFGSDGLARPDDPVYRT